MIIYLKHKPKSHVLQISDTPTSRLEALLFVNSGKLEEFIKKKTDLKIRC